LAFAALRADGSVVTWGKADYGGDSSAVAASLDGTIDVTQVFSAQGAFAALRADGSVVTWGVPGEGGDSSAVATKLDGTIDVTQLFSTGGAFAALRADGSVVTWGYADSGGDSSAVASKLDGTIDVMQVFSAQSAFAALRADGSVVTWGVSDYGGDSSAVAAALDGTIDVTQVFSAQYAFAALRADGSVVTWGNAGFGGDSSAVASQLHDVVSMANPFTNDVFTDTPPTASNRTITTNEDTARALAAADFGFADVDTGDTLQSVTLTSLPTAGSLQLNGLAVTAGQVISVADLSAGKLVFTPAANANGSAYASFGFKVSDGTALSASAYTLTANVTAVNDAPTASNRTITTNEDTARALAVADFGFVDVDTGNTLQSVTLTSLPTAGSLKLNGLAVTANQVVSVAEITAGHLVFTPAANANGLGYASFSFKVSDGTALSASAYTLTANVTAVNDAPTASNRTITTNEDTARALAAADFGFVDVDSGDTLQSVTLTSVPTAGSLQLNGLAVTANQVVSVAEINAGHLIFTPAANANGLGYASFGFKVSDGTALSASAYTLTAHVTAVNDAPTASNRTITTNEDTARALAVADFGFVDVDTGDTLQSVTLTSLPTAGSLKLNGLAVTAGQVISVAEITAGHLIFTPAANANGLGYASFSFKVSDGTALSASAYTLTANVTAVNDAPTASNRTITTNEDTARALAVADFGFADVDPGNTLQSVTLTSLPTAGSLKLNGLAVTAGQVVSVADLTAGHLIFTPAANANGLGYASFSFKVSDGTALSASAYTLTAHVTAVNDAPTASNRTITTNEDTARALAAADFGFADVDPGDTLQSVTLTSLPTAGSLKLNGLAVTAGQVISVAEISAGKLVFTPAANANGSAYASFGFKVSDGTALSAVAYILTVDVSAVRDDLIKTGTSGNDTLVGDAIDIGSFDSLTGLAGNDSLSGGAGNDSLDGGPGNDSLNGGSGADSLIGGDGSDLYTVDNAGDIVSETNAVLASGGTDTVYSDLSAYTLTANVENGRILSTTVANLTGNTLNNVLYAGAGNNGLNGGSGIDTVSYAYGLAGTSGVTVSLAVDTAQATGGSGSDTLTSIENLIGSAYADRLTGNTGANSLAGGAGSDTLDGGAGSDTLAGGDGSDAYFVRDGGDVVSETNAVLATGGTDTVYSYLSAYTLTANVENGRILSTTVANLTGNTLNNVLYAGAGSNVLNGGSGIDTVSYAYGLAGTSGVTVSLAVGTAQATGGSGSDTLTSIENLIGSAYADRLTGNTGANSLGGGAGNDTFDGGAGSDTLAGGDGSDTYVVRDGGDVVSETNAVLATGGSDTVYSTLAAYTLTANVENGRILATVAANLTGNTLNNVLYAGAGNNVLDGGSGIDTVSYAYGLAGTSGVTVSLAVGTAQATGGSGSDTLTSIENLIGSAYADRLTGNTGANSLGGGAGNDTFDGGAGSDTLAGGDGSDTYVVRDGGDVVSETNAVLASGGNDTVYSSLAAYTLTANVENGRILATVAANLTGNTLNNVLYAGAGNNGLDGGSGIDTVSYAYGLAGTTGVIVSLAEGTTQATGGSGSDTLTSIENLIGSGFNDSLTGNAGHNTLDGAAGNDLLTGGIGHDMLTGGSGSDTFDFNALSEMGLTSATWDVINDFAPGLDRIDLSTLDANAALAGNQAFSAPVVGGTFSGAFATAGDLYFDNVAHVLYGNTDADAAAEFAIQFVGVSTLTAADLYL
jgi:Ca2+-binding RTX toxin-like protein